MSEPQTKEEAAALAVLAKRGRLLVIVIPRGVERDEVLVIRDEVTAKLEYLVTRRGKMS